MGELEAVHLQQVEEGVSHHVRYAVVRLRQTAVEPADEYLISSKHFFKKPQSIHSFNKKEMFPTFCRSRSETW